MKSEIVQIFDLVPGENSQKITLSNGKSVRLIKNEEGIFEVSFNIVEEDLNGLKMVNDEGFEFQIEIQEVVS